MTHLDFPALLQAFFTDRLIKQRRASPHTVAAYRNTFRLLLRFAAAHRRRAPSSGGPIAAHAASRRTGAARRPDLAVVCGPVELIPERPDTATNPALLIEVLSHATRTYDRGHYPDRRIIPRRQRRAVAKLGISGPDEHRTRDNQRASRKVRSASPGR
jgi:hypothetical protein